MKRYLKRRLITAARVMLKHAADTRIVQLSLMQNYRRLAETGHLPGFRDVGFRQFSQHDEDGILLFIFSVIGTTNRTCVEICAGDGTECNATNLILNHGWWAALFDGDKNNVRRGCEFFASHPDTRLLPPMFTTAWVTAENVNDLIADCGMKGEIDLLSLDVDGVDYWLWKAIDVIAPHVVVCEYHNPIPPNLALTVPYDPDFRIASYKDDFRSASLLAMTKLSRSKGYRLVGVNRYGFNAFFIKKGIAEDLLPEVTPQACASDPYTLKAQRTRWPRVKNKGWVSV